MHRDVLLVDDVKRLGHQRPQLGCEDRDLLQSGWLVGEDNLTRRAAVIAAKSGQGRVVLIGFPAQHRAQMHGTYKLLFNALVR